MYKLQNFNQHIQYIHFTGAFQAFYKRTRSSLSRAFTYLKYLQIICEEVICNEVARCSPASLWKNSFTHRPSCILPSFSQNASRLLLSKRLWKCASIISFINICSIAVDFRQLHLECGIWCCSEYVFCQVNCNSLFLEIQRLQELRFFCSASVFWYALFFIKT